MTEAANSYRPFPSFREWAAEAPELGFWAETLATLEGERESAPEEAVSTSARIIARAAAVDTSAIEGFYEVDRGFTISVATQAAGWEVAFAEKGAKARSMFDAQMRAFELVLDAATNHLPVTEALIRSLHEHTCAAQKTYKVLTDVGWQEHELPMGKYKEHPNNPRTANGTLHAYAPVAMVSPEMARLVDELTGDDFASAPAPLQAAYAHYALVAVHPFADGNGRVARALASIHLVRATSVPLLVFADQKPRYLDALTDADAGNYATFSAFVRDRSTDAMNLLINGIQRVKAGSPDELQKDVRRLFYSTPALKVDSLAVRLLNEARDSFEPAFERLDLAEEINLYMKMDSGEIGSPSPGYRSLGQRHPPCLEIRVESAQVAGASCFAIIRPQVARDDSHPSPIRLEEVNRGLLLDACVEDLSPEISTVVQLRLETWIETLLRTMVREVITKGERALEPTGGNG